MSRSIKGKKSPGHDFWSKRPYSGAGYGPEVKKMTHKKERAQTKQKLHKIKKGQNVDQ